jgi:CMP-2-keto-3-deoxyoctulosonic acid synthetase
MEVRLEDNMVAALVMDPVLEVVLEVVLEACLGAYLVVVDHRYGAVLMTQKNSLTTSSITSQITETMATLVPRQAEPTLAPRRQLPTIPVRKAVNTAAALQVTQATHRLRPPTEVMVQNNILPSRSTASKVTARRLASVHSRDMVGQHQATVKARQQEAHQAATDNKVRRKHSQGEDV